MATEQRMCLSFLLNDRDEEVGPNLSLPTSLPTLSEAFAHLDRGYSTSGCSGEYLDDNLPRMAVWEGLSSDQIHLRRREGHLSLSGYCTASHGGQRNNTNGTDDIHNNDSEDNEEHSKGGEYIALVTSSTLGGIGEGDSSFRRVRSAGYFTDTIEPWGLPVVPFLHDWRISRTTSPTQQPTNHNCTNTSNTQPPDPKPLLIQENIFVQEDHNNINDYTNGDPPIRKRRKRVNKEKSFILEAEFRKNPRPTTEKKRQLAVLLDLDLARVHGW